MELYTVLLFFHVFGVIALFGALVLLQNSGMRLRGATNWDEARPLIDLLRPVAGMFGFGGALLLVSGIWMTTLRWSFATPWAMSGMVVLVLAGVVGAITVVRLSARLRPLALQSRGPVDDAARAAFAPSHRTWAVMFAINFAAVGVVWLMTVKPGPAQSIVVPLALAIAGALTGSTVGQAPRAAHRPQPRPFRHRQPAS